MNETSQLKELRFKKMWIGKLAYLADIFSRLNDRSSSFQGYFINYVTKLLKIKLLFFCNRCLQKSDIDMFPSLQDFAPSISVDTKVLFVIVSQH